MYANSEFDQNESIFAAHASVQVSALLGYAALIFSEVGQLEAARVGGTVDATVELSERHYFAGPSETLIRGIPVATKEVANLLPRRQTRAKDLIAELDAINTQIHQIMFQVEKAVARLATSG